MNKKNMVKKNKKLSFSSLDLKLITFYHKHRSFMYQE